MTATALVLFTSETGGPTFDDFEDAAPNTIFDAASTTTPKHGEKCIRVTAESNVACSGWAAINAAWAAGHHVWIGGWVRMLSSSAAADFSLFTLYGGGGTTEYMDVAMSWTGAAFAQWSVIKGSDAAAKVLIGPTFTANTWYWVILHLQKGTPGVSEIYVGNGSVKPAPSDTDIGPGDFTVGTFYVGTHRQKGASAKIFDVEDAGVWTSATDEFPLPPNDPLNIRQRIKQGDFMQTRKTGTTTDPVVIYMTDSSDHVSPKTGLAPTITISKAGSTTFGTANGATAELGSGWYSLAGHTSDRDTIGVNIVKATAAGADPWPGIVNIVSYDPLNIAEPGDQMSFVDAPNTTGVAAIKTQLAGVQADFVNAPNTTGVAAIKTGIAGVQADFVDAPNTTGVAAIKTGIAGVQADFVNAPNTTGVAAIKTGIAGAQMDLVNAPNTTAVGVLKSGLSTHAAADVVALALATPTNKIVTDVSGRVNIAPAGLDAITVTAPTGVATTFPQILTQIWRRFFSKAVMVASGGTGTIKTYADDGTTEISSQTITEDGTTQTQGAAS